MFASVTACYMFFPFSKCGHIEESGAPDTGSWIRNGLLIQTDKH